MNSIDREQLQKMIDEGAVTVVEVLNPENFKTFHLPGAKNAPLSENFEENIQSAVPDKHQPVVVYCMDKECNASPEAAKRMESCGYDRVYDYEAGKIDWKDAGLPTEA